MRLSFTSDWKPAATCAQAWHAERVARTYRRPTKECFATGSLFHAVALTPERIPAVYAEYGDLLVTSKAGKGGPAGSPNAAARDAIACAEYTRSRPQVAELLAGARCETELTFDLDGMAWVAHVDLITAAGCVIDFKTCAKIEGIEWSDWQHRYVPWHMAMLYWYQLALYRRALGGAPAVAIVACQDCTEPPPDVRIIELQADSDEVLDQYAADIEASMRHEWTSPATGKRLPPFAEMVQMDTADLHRCESCHYCRTSRRDLYFPFAIPRTGGV